jgi:hypothetical protein
MLGTTYTWSKTARSGATSVVTDAPELESVG